ncbi:PREDICTED: histone deacetylase 6 isoform X1 [Nicrophorus vespilloides]|uniref:Histone deacetylase 6 isoform X1 n=1 Tax=Nicrophorus vespilloides TaxID=110193 RepID=A0ABM1NGL6_NICVS|nr:PREDICTED: histone deacetylase 6 isoform X1 [Nicrophorus vespilloides]
MSDNASAAVPMPEIGAGDSNVPRETLRDFKKRMKQNSPETNMELENCLVDDYEVSTSCDGMVRKPTGVIYNNDMLRHKCVWDSRYPENPDRYSAIIQRIREQGLFDECKLIDVLRKFDKQLPATVIAQLEKLKNICEKFHPLETEKVASKYDAIYFNEHTYDSTLTALYSTLSLVKNIAEGVIQNGLAIVRPPGHHAQKDNFNGYCFINNVGCAAHYLLETQKLKKIMIIDFDVHHGQGTQQMFYKDNRVLYFSIHRYENGLFWPNLRESSFDYIGEGPGVGYNINVPLNATGLGDADYMAVLTHILLPIAYEFQADMILFSAGYDACIGCPEGEMCVSPGFYGHMIKLLSGVAEGKLAVILEGGYFLPSLAEGVSMTLRALLDDRPAVLPPLGQAHKEVRQMINNIKCVLHEFWGCFKVYNRYDLEDSGMKDIIHHVVIKYFGKEFTPPFETRNCYPVMSAAVYEKCSNFIEDLKQYYGEFKRNKVCYGYDDDMGLHMDESNAIETPARLQAVYERFKELELDKRCVKIDIPELSGEEWAKKTHITSYVTQLTVEGYVPTAQSNDMYWNPKGSKISILKAVNTVLSVTDAVLSGNFASGVAIVRPPGHHAEPSKSLGFCYLNNVAVAARYALDTFNLEKILIVDFDIHHGNGTQKIFYDTERVLYLSIHKYEQGTYFPSTQDGSSTKTGRGLGTGYNVNVPFNSSRAQEKMGDTEYLNAFCRIVLPIAYQYAPELVIVSAGFDAGVNDLLGNYRVHPETFGHMIQLLRSLAGGRLIVSMEGGYNTTTLKHSMNFCVKALLGDPLPRLKIEMPKLHAYKAFEEVIDIQKEFWSILNVDKHLPDRLSGLALKEEDVEVLISRYGRKPSNEVNVSESVASEVSSMLKNISLMHD